MSVKLESKLDTRGLEALLRAVKMEVRRLELEARVVRERLKVFDEKFRIDSRTFLRST